jgi:hypothetical protein
MTTRYADRAFISVNGAAVADLQSASLKQVHNRKVVPSMTPDNFNRGFVQGNMDIDITATIAVQNQLGRPKLELIDYENNNVQITFVVGADQYVATGLFLKDNDDNASGIGQEVKTTFNFGAIKLSDATGNSSLFNINLG